MTGNIILMIFPTAKRNDRINKSNLLYESKRSNSVQIRERELFRVCRTGGGYAVEVTTSSDDLSYFLLVWNVVTILQVAGNPRMSASAFSHSNTSRCVDVIHCIPAAIHPDRSAASQWIRRSFFEKQFDRISGESFYGISRRFHSFEAILLSFLYDRQIIFEICNRSKTKCAQNDGHCRSPWYSA